MRQVDAYDFHSICEGVECQEGFDWKTVLADTEFGCDVDIASWAGVRAWWQNDVPVCTSHVHTSLVIGDLQQPPRGDSTRMHVYLVFKMHFNDVLKCQSCKKMFVHRS